MNTRHVAVDYEARAIIAGPAEVPTRNVIG